MRILLILIFAPLIALALMYFVFPGRLVAIGRSLLRRRGGMVQKCIVVDGRSGPYLEGGDASKPLLLLVHGFAGDKDNWSMIAPYLTRDYHVIAPDLPGFGRSEEHTSELQSLLRISYAVFCLTTKNTIHTHDKQLSHTIHMHNHNL